jgi:hypothetical protein
MNGMGMRPGTCSGRSRFCRSHVVADPQNREVVSRTPSVALADACEPSEGIDRSALLSHLTVFPLPCRWHRCSQLVPSGERTSESDAKAAAFCEERTEEASPGLSGFRVSSAFMVLGVQLHREI